MVRTVIQPKNYCCKCQTKRSYEVKETSKKSQVHTFSIALVMVQIDLLAFCPIQGKINAVRSQMQDLTAASTDFILFHKEIIRSQCGNKGKIKNDIEDPETADYLTMTIYCLSQLVVISKHDKGTVQNGSGKKIQPPDDVNTWFAAPTRRCCFAF